MAQKKQLKPSEHATRALSAASQGARGMMLPGAASMGLLALAPFARKLTQDTAHVPKGFKTNTPSELAGLADRLLRAGGRNPDTGRPIVLQVSSKPGSAEAIQEYTPRKGKTKARDILRLGLGATPESVAHEVGHVTPENRLSRALSKLSPLARSKPAQMLPALLAATALFGDPNKETPAIAKAAPYVGGAQLAAILGEEVRANRRSSKLLENIGYKTLLKQRIGRHSLALAYLPYAAALIGAPLGILKGIKAFDKAREQKREIPPLELLGRSPQDLADTPSTKELQKKWKPFFESR